MNKNDLHKMAPKSRADKSQCSNLQKEKEVISVILFRGVSHSIPCIQPAQHCQGSLDDPILLSTFYVIQSNIPPNAFTHFMKILDGAESYSPPLTIGDLMLLARELGYHALIANLAPQQDIPKCEENIYDLSQEFDKPNRMTTIETNFHFNRDSFVVMQRHISATAEGFEENLERIPSELEKMIQL
jgi:hypothetical protein